MLTYNLDLETYILIKPPIVNANGVRMMAATRSSTSQPFTPHFQHQTVPFNVFVPAHWSYSYIRDCTPSERRKYLSPGKGNDSGKETSRGTRKYRLRSGDRLWATHDRAFLRSVVPTQPSRGQQFAAGNRDRLALFCIGSAAPIRRLIAAGIARRKPFDVKQVGSVRPPADGAIKRPVALAAVDVREGK